MSDNELPRITLKGGAGYEAPWITVPFSDVEAAKSHLLAIQSSGLLEAVAQTAELFRGVVSAGPLLPERQSPVPDPTLSGGQVGPPQGAWGTVTGQGFQPAQQGQQWQSGQAPPQQQGPELHPEGLRCQSCGGFVQKKNLTRKSDNKAFSLWTCPNQRSKGDGHFSEFAN